MHIYIMCMCSSAAKKKEEFMLMNWISEPQSGGWKKRGEKRFIINFFFSWKRAKKSRYLVNQRIIVKVGLRSKLYDILLSCAGYLSDIKE